MALNFGKGNRSVAFNPTSAFPLDARSYFESYELAVAAARTAEEAGSSNTQYYFGQNLAVVENGVANFYIIQPDGTLGEIGGKIEINEQIFVKDSNGKLSIKDFANAVAGAQLVKGEDGSVKWVKPDSTTVDGLATIIETLSDTVDTLRADVDSLVENTYTKEQTEEKIAEAIAGVDHLERVIVDSIDEININDENAYKFIYMVPTGLQLDDDKYDEYIVVEGKLEKVGSWEVDLSAYAKTADVNSALANKVDIDSNARLLTLAEGEKLAGIEEEAEKNIVDDVSDEFDIDENRTLSIKSIAQTKVEGLVDLLETIISDIEGANTNIDNKVDKVEGSRLIKSEEIVKLNEIKDLIQSVDEEKFTIDENGKLLLNNIDIDDVIGLTAELSNKVNKEPGQRLITQAEAEKLGALVLENGEITVSGSVNAANVKELYDVVYRIITGTDVAVFDGVERDLLGIEPGAQKNYISAVNTNQLSVHEGLLSVTAVDKSLVTGLSDALDNKADKSVVLDLTDYLNSVVKNYDTRLTNLENRTTWVQL